MTKFHRTTAVRHLRMSFSSPRDRRANGAPCHRSLDDVIGDEPGVAGDAGKSAGAPGMQPGQAEEIDARRLRHAAMMFRLARAIENRRIEPAEIRLEPDAPDDAPDALRREIECYRIFRRFPDRPISRGWRRG